MNLSTNYDSIVLKYHVDSENNPYALHVVEDKTISAEHNITTLLQIPDEFGRLTILSPVGMTEVFNIDEIKENNYMVDYTHGKIFFHKSMAKKTVQVEYYGIGLELISTDRIFRTKDGSVIETLEEFIRSGETQLEIIADLGDAGTIITTLKADIASGKDLHKALTDDIALGTPLDASLSGHVAEGKTLDTSLSGNIKTGTTLNTNLSNNITAGTNINNTLRQSLQDSADHIEIIRGTANKGINITSANWSADKNLDGFYTCTITHTLNSQDLHITIYQSNQSAEVCKNIIDNTHFQLCSDTKDAIRVIFSSGFYGGYTSADTQNAIVGLQNTKADKTNVYTKAESDAKHQEVADNIENGGAINIIENSAFIDNANALNQWEASKSTSLRIYKYPNDEMNLKYAIRCFATATGITYLFMTSVQKFNIYAGKKYTLSYKMRSYSGFYAADMNRNSLVNPVNGTAMLLSSFDDYKLTTKQLSDGYYRIKIQFTSPTALTQTQLIIGGTARTLEPDTTGFGVTEIYLGEGQGAWYPNPNEIYSNKVKINKDKVEFNNSGVLVTSDSVRVNHTDGSYTTLDKDGLIRGKGTNANMNRDIPYFYLITQGTVNGTSIPIGKNTIKVQLPNEYKGKNFSATTTIRGWYFNESYAPSRLTTGEVWNENSIRDGFFEVYISCSASDQPNINVAYFVIA